MRLNALAPCAGKDEMIQKAQAISKKLTRASQEQTLSTQVALNPSLELWCSSSFEIKSSEPLLRGPGSGAHLFHNSLLHVGDLSYSAVFNQRGFKHTSANAHHPPFLLKLGHRADKTARVLRPMEGKQEGACICTLVVHAFDLVGEPWSCSLHYNQTLDKNTNNPHLPDLSLHGLKQSCSTTSHHFNWQWSFSRVRHPTAQDTTVLHVSGA